jgi:hypothetical protein
VKHADNEAELTRLLESEQSGLADSVAALRQHGPDATELASLASRLALQGIDVTAQPPANAPKSWKKWLWGGGGGAAIVALGLAWRGQQPPVATLPPPVPSAVVAVAGEVAVAATTSAATATRRATGGVLHAPDEAAAAREPRVVDSVEASPAQPATEATLPEAVRPTPSMPSVASPRPATERPTATNATNNGATASTPLPERADAAQPTEIELLRDARQALRSAPARALALADEHARLYPRGKLTQERELIAISALVALGRRTAALSRGASFESQYPTSPYRKQVGELLR